MKHLVIIAGAGNIGSRHMQAFTASAEPLQLMVIDPSEESLQRARLLWENSGGNNSPATAVFSHTPDAAPSSCSLLIVATNANQRLSALKQMLKKTRPEYIILEKFLFNQIEEYNQTDSLIATYPKENVMVNCPRRLFEGYRYLSSMLNSSEPFSMHIKGSSWGMGSNTIHFMDLFSMLTRDVKISSCTFHNAANTRVEPGKRAGYMEIFGEMNIQSFAGSTLSVYCDPEPFSDISIKIIQNQSEFAITEKAGKLRIAHGSQPVKEYPMPFQSQLSYMYYDILCIKKKKLYLTPYSVSKKLHLCFLAALNELAVKKKSTETWNVS